jgi:hypothetical protein
MIRMVFQEQTDNYLPIFADEALFAWLRLHNVFADKAVSQVSYNPIYHFYDFSVFPSKNSNWDGMNRALTKLKDAHPGRIKQASYTWRWEKSADGESVKRHGLRFWITASEEPI